MLTAAIDARLRAGAAFNKTPRGVRLRIKNKKMGCH
jgi:hypothetical protein